jgi:hypothetical protein
MMAVCSVVRAGGAPGVREGPGRRDCFDNAVPEMSAVVASCAMNRERQLAGVNSYTRELGFDPLQVVTAQIGGGRVRGGTAAWLDLCCGSGRALIQAARQVHQAGWPGGSSWPGLTSWTPSTLRPARVPGLEPPRNRAIPRRRVGPRASDRAALPILDDVESRYLGLEPSGAHRMSDFGITQLLAGLRAGACDRFLGLEATARPL